jgi:hypothetical protein
MKQTAVDWLVDKYINGNYEIEVYEQAKQMEKEQMIDFAFKYGDLTMREMSDSFDKEYK